jgi:hypothetical protein
MSQLPELLGNKNMELDMYSLRGNPLARSPGQVKLDSDKQDSKLTDAKTLNASVFFILRLKIVTGTTKNGVHISASVAQKLYISTFVLFRNVCFLFLILE